MPCLYTDENCGYFYAPTVTKRAQAKEIPGPLMPLAPPNQRKLMTWSLCGPGTLLSPQLEHPEGPEPSLGLHRQERTAVYQLPWVLWTKIPTSKRQ